MDEQENVGRHEPGASESAAPARRRRAPSPTGWPLVLLFVLLATRAVFLVDGAVGSFGEKGSGDLYARYTEFQWVRAGQDPYPALRRLRIDAGRFVRPDEAVRVPTLEEISVGEFADGDFSKVNPALAHYPQWSYPLLAPLLLVPWPATIWALLTLDLLTFALFLWWARSLLDGWWGWLAAFVVLIPVHSWSVGLFVGQLSILMMGVQVLLLRSLAENRVGMATVSLSWLAVKPTSGTLFGWLLLLPWLQKRTSPRFVVQSVAGVAVVLLGATSAVSIWTDTAPWTWLSHVYGDNRGAVNAGYGFLPLLGTAAGASGVVTLGAAVCGFVVQGAAVWFLRHSSLLVHFAVAGCISRYWAYHRHYDDVLLLFLLLALVVECRRGSWLCGIALLALASAFGTPTPSSALMSGWRVALAWITLVVLVVEHRRSVRALVDEPSTRGRILDGLHQASSESAH